MTRRPYAFSAFTNLAIEFSLTNPNAEKTRVLSSPEWDDL
jgi:hypothetical protein